MKPNIYAPKPLNLLNQNDRLAMLLDMGVSPGDDDSYEVQAKKLLAQKDRLIDNKKLNMLQQIERAIQTNRNLQSPEGPLNPVDFLRETLAKSIPAPSELDIDKISRSIPAIGQGIKDIVSHPLASLKQAALNGPPEPTTMASMLLPGAALKAYRELAPLEARTYLHHMAGVPTPFTHVNEKERAALTELAQNKINSLIRNQQDLEKLRSKALKNVNEIKLMNRSELIEHLKEEGLSVPRHHNGTIRSTSELRDYAVENYKLLRPSVFMPSEYDRRAYLNLGEREDNANVREDFLRLTGKRMPTFQIYPDDFATALGKTYVEPMIDKTTGQIVPKSIKDTYKFYPDVYGFSEGEARRNLKQNLKELIEGIKSVSGKGYRPSAMLYQGQSTINEIKRFFRNTFSMGSHEPLGIVARKLGFMRPTSIIDIPLQAPAPLNAYDKAAILMGAKALKDKKE